MHVDLLFFEKKREKKGGKKREKKGEKMHVDL